MISWARGRGTLPAAQFTCGRGLLELLQNGMFILDTCDDACLNDSWPEPSCTADCCSRFYKLWVVNKIDLLPVTFSYISIVGDWQAETKSSHCTGLGGPMMKMCQDQDIYLSGIPERAAEEIRNMG